MGRAFEYRKARKMKRWASMAKNFTRAGREIAIAVKAGGPEPEINPRLRVAMQNAKSVSMPKDRIMAAIKRASDKDTSNYEEISYEGYAPHGVAVFVDCATDNTTRTVANVRHAFSKYGGSLGTSGSLSFLFDRKGVFTIDPATIEMEQEELELELIDFGLEEIKTDEDEEDNPIWMLFCDILDYGSLQSGLEDLKIEVKKSELQRLPLTNVELDEEQAEEVMKILDKLDDEEDVMNVWTNIA